MATSFDQVILAPRVPAATASSQDPPFKIVRYPYFPRRFEGLAADAIMPTLRRQPWRLIEAPFLVLQMRRRAHRLAASGAFSAVLAHWIFPGGWIARSLKRRFGIPYTVTPHGGDVFALRGRIFRRIRDAVIRDAAAILPVSQDILETLDLSGDPRVQVIPMGALVPEIERTTQPRARGTFLFVGRLADKKGVDVVLRALARLSSGTLTIVGSGPEENALRKLAGDLGIEGRVTFAGKQPKVEVYRLLQEATALLIPSRVSKSGDKDGTPVVLAEAVSVCTPVIASRLAGLAEQIRDGETGLLVDPDDVDGLAQAMQRFLEDPDYAFGLGRNAEAGFEESTLNMETVASLYEEIVRRVIETHPAN